MRVLLLLGCAACAGTGGGRLAARLQRPHNPEQRFDVAAGAKQCAGGHGVLLEAASEAGNGLLLWLRGDSTTPGEYALRTASDTGDIAHGLTLDSGVVRLSAGRPRLAGDIVAAGTDLGGVQHVTFTAHFADVAVADSTRCAP